MTEEKFLEEKVALVTGAGSGFGREMAIAFASKGANLVLNDVNLEIIEETREIILKTYNVEILLAKADISDFNQVKEMRNRVFEKFDNLFILVNNAGVREGTFSLVTKEDVYNKVMDVNVKGAWNVTKAFYRKMCKQNFKPIAGKIINIASCAGTQCGVNPYIGIYSVSKAALIAFTKLWAIELGSNNIAVNAICPGLFLTPLYKNNPEFIREFARRRNVKLPLDRIGESKQVADVALFLASPASDYITGHSIILDGGMTISVNSL
ncbi:MAG: SDR family NAD(P)-dependent oxidoreductase [Candidatus Hodarchaeota archaeon]